MLGAHVGGSADEGFVDGKSSCFSFEWIDGFGDAEVDDLGGGFAVLFADENVGRFDIAVNDALLVGVLDGLTDLDEDGKAVLNGELPFVAILGEWITGNVFHDEIRSSFFSRSRIDYTGDVRVIHAGECLSFRFEACDDAFGIEPQFEDF